MFLRRGKRRRCAFQGADRGMFLPPVLAFSRRARR